MLTVGISGQLLSTQHSGPAVAQAPNSGILNQPVLADSPFPFPDVFPPQAQLLQQSLSQTIKTGSHGQSHGSVTCDGIAQEYCAKPGHFYPR